MPLSPRKVGLPDPDRRSHPLARGRTAGPALRTAVLVPVTDDNSACDEREDVGPERETVALAAGLEGRND